LGRSQSDPGNPVGVVCVRGVRASPEGSHLKIQEAPKGTEPKKKAGSDNIRLLAVDEMENAHVAYRGLKVPSAKW
jgi:hypothetical protein